VLRAAMTSSIVAWHPDLADEARLAVQDCGQLRSRHALRLLREPKCARSDARLCQAQRSHGI
jgi:hypothetical protein